MQRRGAEQAAMAQQDESLAGLTCIFRPVSLQLPAKTGKAAARRSPDGQRGQQGQQPGGAGGGGLGGRAVAFNLKARKPGPAYSSPEAAACQNTPQQAERGSRLPGPAGVPSVAGSRGRQLKGSTPGLAHLKLASLARRRAAPQQSGQQPAPSSQRPAAGAHAAAVTAPAPPLLRATPTAVTTVAPSIEPPPPQAQGVAPTADRQAELLHGMECMLAGCSSRVLEDPPPAVLPPEHVLVGMPVLAIPAQAPEQAPAQQPAVLAAGSTAAASGAPHVGPPLALTAYAAGEGSCQVAAVQQPALPSSTHDPSQQQPIAGALVSAPAGDTQPDPAVSVPAGPDSSTWAPNSLESALQCLGLLLPPEAFGEEESAATGAEGAGVGAGHGHQLPHIPAPSPAHDPWVRLRAVQLILDAQQQTAAEGELLPLLRRLRQVRMNLAVAQAALHRGRSRSPRRGSGGSSAAGGGLPSPVGPPGPWLSGRSSAVESKHRSSRSLSPGSQLGPRPEVATSNPEACELQVRLLTSLQHKLLLKLGLAVLRQAAAVNRQRQRLLEHVAALGSADLHRSVLLHWHDAAVPSQQQVAAAQCLARQLEQRHQQQQLLAWQEWAAHHAWRRRQLEQGQQVLRRRLLAAAVQHWRYFCQQQLVQRLQEALAARWLAAWGRRRVFCAWRLAARRSACLKEALLVRSVGSCHVHEGPVFDGPQGRPMSLPEALSATAAAFQHVKSYVAEAAQQLPALRQGLRFQGARSPAGSNSCSGTAAAAAGEAVGAPGLEGEAPPLGSVEALLGMLPARQNRLVRQEEPQALGPAAASIASSLAPPLHAAAGPPPAAQHAPHTQLPAGAGLAAAAGHAFLGTSAIHHLPAAPAPDPGSPCAYNPVSYTSPRKPTALQRQPQRLGQGPASAARDSGAAASLLRPAGGAAAEPSAAVQAELNDCQEQVQHLRRQLAALEQEAEQLQQQSAELDRDEIAAAGALTAQQQACAAAASAKDAAAEAMQAAAVRHAAAAAECGAQERLLRQRQQECQDAVAAEAGAKAAEHAAAELHALSHAGVQRWSKAVDALAKELAACHRTQKAPVLVRLKEARQRLEQHQQELAAAAAQLPQLQAVAKQAAAEMQRAQQAVLEAQQGVVAAAEQRALMQQQLASAMGQHEAAAVAAVAGEQEASACEQRCRLLASQQQLASGRMRQVMQQVMHKQQAAELLQSQVQQLQQRHRDAIAAELAAGQQQRRGKLKRRLHVEHDSEAAAFEPAVQHVPAWPPLSVFPAPLPAAPLAGAPPAGVASGAQSAGDCHQEHFTALRIQPSAWSCFSSELGSPSVMEEAPLGPLLTVDEAAAHFCCRTLLRRALRGWQLQTQATEEAMLAAAARWRRKQLAAVLAAWRRHTAEAGSWLASVTFDLRRRWLLRQWRVVAAERLWQRDAEAAADAFARWWLLRTGLLAWRQCVRHEQWRDVAHEAVVHGRMRRMLQRWRAWARRRRQKAAREGAALATYQRRLLAAAFQQWRWVQHGRSLLVRVFTTAVELWQDEVGVRLHQRNFERVAECWRAWQLHVLECQAQRRSAILWNAAVAFREKQLLMAGFQAFRQAVADAREERRLELLRAQMFSQWRHLAATSARHWEYESARQHRRDWMLRCALEAWRGAAEHTASQLAHFWLRWQVQVPLRRALLGWRACAAFHNRELQQQALALSFRRLRRQRRCLAAWRQLAVAQREMRALQGIAEGHRVRQQQQQQVGQPAASSSAAQPRQLQGTGQSRSPGGSRRKQQHSSGHQPAAARGTTPAATLAQATRAQLSSQREEADGSDSRGAPGNRTVTTIIISRGGDQVPAAVSGQQHQQQVAQGQGAAIGGGSSVPLQHMVVAVSSWKEAADYWRQRQQSYSQQVPLPPPPLLLPAADHLPQGSAGSGGSGISPQTAATLAELRSQWQQL